MRRAAELRCAHREDRRLTNNKGSLLATVEGTRVKIERQRYGVAAPDEDEAARGWVQFVTDRPYVVDLADPRESLGIETIQCRVCSGYWIIGPTSSGAHGQYVNPQVLVYDV